MRIGFRQPALVLLAMTLVLSGMARGQSSGDAGIFSGARKRVVPKRTSEPYHEPTQKQRLQIYRAQMFAPYSLASVMFVSGLQQAEHYPQEWQEGWAGFGQRLASNTGTDMANATARYLLSDALREDARYYRCACSGFWPRLGHAFFSPAMARRGADGHEVLGVPNLLAPYAGPFASVYGWYPSRYDWEAAFRMGNHGLLNEIGTNISLEFLPSILHRRGRRWERRLHLGNPSGAAGAP
ncbi:MAG TPA: hypothetical protein VGR47_09600 [Terracidiphilus sp.]|nr:hypothetical protein [Terracidiphilus sp.]